MIEHLPLALKLLGITKDTIGWIIKYVQPKIETSPKKIQVNTSDWQNKGYFVVINKTEKPLYNVQILLWDNNGNLEEQFPLAIIDIERDKNEFETHLGPIIVDGGVLIVDGLAKKKKVKILQLNYLGPKKDLKVFYSFSNQSVCKIHIQAINYSSSPSQILKKENKLSINFKSPNEITVSSISLFMKKDKVV